MQVNTISKQLMFSTVRIVNILPSGQASVGTGFLMDADPQEASQVPILVTNKHVVSGAQILQFEFTKQGPDGMPLLGETHQVTMADPGRAWVGHPDPAVDVAVMPLATVLAQVGVPLFFRTVPITTFPTPDAADELDALETITFVGYPDGHLDPKHKTPIFRRGITATPVTLPFGGRPVFLLDGSVFGGSSGSPAFILDEGSYKTPTGITLGTRLLLVGVVAETVVRNKALPLQVAQSPHVALAQELNLGVVFNWMAIDETIDALFAAVGQARPPKPALAPTPPPGASGA